MAVETLWRLILLIDGKEGRLWISRGLLITYPVFHFVSAKFEYTLWLLHLIDCR